MLILLMLLYSALASSGFFSSNDTEEQSTTVAMYASNIKVKRNTDIPRQTNYVTKHIDRCPDVGYFFKKDFPAPNSNRPGLCHLCFCKKNDTAICWPRASKRCDSEHFHYHDIGKREQQRSRRSPMSLSDIFVRDATRDVFNKQTPEQCKPHEASYSEGCPPADWCVGCTVCDCNVNGRWDCHLLSFCTEEDKKKKRKVNRGRTYVQRSIDEERVASPRPARTKEEHAQREVQRLAQLISKIGDKQARQLKGQKPKHYHKREGKLNSTKKSSSIDPIKIIKIKTIQSQREKTKASKTHLKTIYNLKKLKVQEEKVINEVHKQNVDVFNKAHLKRSPKVVTPVKKNNGKLPSTLEAQKKSILEAINLSNAKNKKQFKKEPKSQFYEQMKRQLNEQAKKPVKDSKKKLNSDAKKQPNGKPKNSKEPVGKLQQPKRRHHVKAKRVKRTKQATTIKPTTTTVKSKKHKKKNSKRHVASAPQIDRERLLRDIQKKFQQKLMDEVDRFMFKESVQKTALKSKRSAPLFKKIDNKKNLYNKTNLTRLKGASKPVNRSSKIALEKSNKTKLHRNRRSVLNDDDFATKWLRSEVHHDILKDSSKLLPIITPNSTQTTQSIDNYFNYSVDDTMPRPTFSHDYFTEKLCTKNSAAKRSVDTQTKVLSSFSVIKLDDKEEIKNVTVYDLKKNKIDLLQTVPALPANNFVLNITDFFNHKSLGDISGQSTEKQELTTKVTYTTEFSLQKYDFGTADSEVEVNMLQQAQSVTTIGKTAKEHNIPLKHKVTETASKNNEPKASTQGKVLLATEKISSLKENSATHSVTGTTFDNHIATTEVRKKFENTTKQNTTLLVQPDMKLSLESSQWVDKAIIVGDKHFDESASGESMLKTPIQSKQNVDYIDIDEIKTADEAYNSQHETEQATKRNTLNTTVKSVNIININEVFIPKNFPNYTDESITIVTTKSYAHQTDKGNNVTKNFDVKVQGNKNKLHELPLRAQQNEKKSDSKIDNHIVIIEEKYNITNGSTIQYNDTLEVLPTESNLKSTFKVKKINNDTDEGLHSNPTTLYYDIVAKPNNYLKNRIGSNNLKYKTRKHEKGSKHSQKQQTNRTEIRKEILSNQKYLKLKHKIDNHFVIILQKNNDSSTALPKKSALNISSVNDSDFYNRLDVLDNITTEDYNLSDQRTNFEYNVINNRLSTSTSVRKVNTYDVKKINTSYKRHKLKKLVATLYNKTNKDERYYVNYNNNYAYTKSNTLLSDMNNLFKKLLSGFPSRYDLSEGSRANIPKIIKYLLKIFKKIFTSGKHTDLQNKTAKPQLNRHDIIKTICATFGPCNINIKNKAKLHSQIDHLSSETDQMFKIVKGLLKLLDFPKNNSQRVIDKNDATRFKSDVQKLHAILRETYINEKHLGILTESQKMQIEYIKKNLRDFIQSAAKFTMTLKDIINLITVGDHRNKEKYKKIIQDKLEKRFITSESYTITTKTETQKPLWKLKDLIARYNVVQNTFMKKIYNVLSDFDNKDGSRKKIDRVIEPRKNIVRNKTEAIQMYTRNIIQNLRQLKDLAQNFEGSVRRKRDLRDDNSMEYLLLLMEYLLKQNHPVDAPVNDGIDLLIEAIKNAPDIKHIKKEVLRLNLDHFDSTITTTTTESVEINVSKENNASDLNQISKEDNYTSSIEEPKFKAIEYSVDEEEEGEHNFLENSRRAINPPPSKKKVHGLKYENKLTKPYLFQKHKPTRITFDNTTALPVQYMSQVYISPYIATEIEVTDTTIDADINSNEKVKVEPLIADLEEDIIVTSPVSDTEITTSETPDTTTVNSKIKMMNYKDVSASKSRLDWLDETYEEEIKQLNATESNVSTTTIAPDKNSQLYGKKPRKLSNESGISQESFEGLKKRRKDEEVICKKEMDLLNSLDYGTVKSDVDVSDSKESISDDKYSGDNLSSNFK